MKRLLLALFTACTLTACASNQSLEQLRVTTPSGDAYQVALANNYKTYAEELAATYDWDTAGYFAEKGLAAAKGISVEPEDPVRWNFQEPVLGALVDSREALMKAIATNSTTQPELAASAVLAYDKLTVLSHQGQSNEDIRAQRNILAALMTKLQEVHVASESTPPPPPTVPAESNRTVLYFPFDSDRLGDSAVGAVQSLVRDLSGGTSPIAINGHADRAGSEEYNMRLSERRARSVLKALEQAGIPGKRMQSFGFGESDPAVPTEDGVEEPKNRRVEITIE